MRGLIVAGCLLFCALLARAQETPGTVKLSDDGFASDGASFVVTFGFSDMQAVPRAAKTARALGVPGAAIPATTWSSAQGAAAQLDLCCLRHAMGLSDVTLAVARLRLSNPTDHPFRTSLAVAIAPRGELRALAFEKHAFFIEGRAVLVADTPSRGAILADAPFASRPLTPQNEAHVESVKGECRGQMLFDLTLAPGQTQTLGFLCPVRLPQDADPKLDFYRALSVEELFTEAQKQTTTSERNAP
jgi:hypothetical protein